MLIYQYNYSINLIVSLWEYVFTTFPSFIREGKFCVVKKKYIMHKKSLSVPKE